MEVAFFKIHYLWTYYVYILHSPNYDKYYVGQTPDLETRLLFHNELAKGSYTSKFRPWELKQAIPFLTRAEAMAAEKYIKGRRSRKYLQQLIEEEQVREELRNFSKSAG